MSGSQNSVNQTQGNIDSQKMAANKFNISHVGRRNLSAYDRGLLALKLQEVLKIKGKENIVKSNKHESSSTTLSNQDKVDSRQEAAKTFNVSEGTLNKVRHIEEKATEDQKKKLKDGKKTINSVYNEIVKEEKRNVSFFNCK